MSTDRRLLQGGDKPARKRSASQLRGQGSRAGQAGDHAGLLIVRQPVLACHEPKGQLRRLLARVAQSHPDKVNSQVNRGRPAYPFLALFSGEGHGWEREAVRWHPMKFTSK